MSEVARMQQGSTNAARHRKKPLTPESKNPVNGGLVRKINTRRNDDNGDVEQQQKQPRRSPRAFSSSWRICLFRMIQLRWLQRATCPRRRRRRRVVAFVGLFLVAFLFILALQPPALHVFFWGDGYHVEGGVLGRIVDHIVAALYYERYSSRRHHDNDGDGDGAVMRMLEYTYPIVKLRANRKEIPGYSRYLEEILTRRQRHLDNNKNKNLATATDWYNTIHGASLDASIMHDSRNVQEWTVDIREPEINENGNSTSNVPAAMRSVVERLRVNGCQPGWICHRCLAVPWWGSLDQCSSSYWACPPCFSSILCSSDDDISSSSSSFKRSEHQQDGERVGGENTVISILAQVTGNYCDVSPRKRRSIPRIVHVVGGPLSSLSSSSSHLDLLQYPELVRIQNGWRAAGYSYRYYTPKSARAFVQRHYPNRFLHVYDALQQSSPFDQQHFFRLLVLFQQGGIVADADLMLEVNPDALFWTDPTDPQQQQQQHQQQPVSFVATMDADMNECLWDGFIAARPGHAVVARAIELFYNRLVVTQRLDDQLEWMRINACQATDDTVKMAGTAAASAATIPLWKVRSQNHALLYHGNAKRRGLTFCIFGEAVHEAQGRTVSWMNTPFQPAFYTMESPHCTNTTTTSDTVICEDEGMRLLMMSRDDTGATRLTDMDRNMLVASTNVVGVAMESISARVNKVFRKSQAGVTHRLRYAIASNKILNSGIPIQIQIRSEEEAP